MRPLKNLFFLGTFSILGCAVPANPDQPDAPSGDNPKPETTSQPQEPAEPGTPDDPTMYVMISMQEKATDWRANLRGWAARQDEQDPGTLTTMHEGRAWTAYPGENEHEHPPGLPHASMLLTYCALRALGAGTIPREPLTDIEHHVRVEIDQSLTLFDVKPDLGVHYRTCAEFVFNELAAEPTTPAGEVVEHVSITFYDPSDP